MSDDAEVVVRWIIKIIADISSQIFVLLLHANFEFQISADQSIMSTSACSSPSFIISSISSLHSSVVNFITIIFYRKVRQHSLVALLLILFFTLKLKTLNFRLNTLLSPSTLSLVSLDQTQDVWNEIEIHSSALQSQTANCDFYFLFWTFSFCYSLFLFSLYIFSLSECRLISKSSHYILLQNARHFTLISCFFLLSTLTNGNGL